MKKYITIAALAVVFIVLFGLWSTDHQTKKSQASVFSVPSV